MKLLRRFVEDPRAVDSVVVVLSTWLVLGAYIDAYAYVYKTGTILEPAHSAGVAIVNAAFSLLTIYLFAGLAVGIRAGRKWNEALPDGHTGSFTALLIFGAAWILDDAFWSRVFGTGGLGLEQLFTPFHLVEIGAAAIVVSGPLRAAARRGEEEAGPVALASSALLLSTFTFVT
ncbi:MAG TPA: hypothetical protein VHO95_05810, partial [Candidatus Dormibacteraeota bacterium]|nr:hypothetical protein [Candidatus Dormibacteraeota bacterium]